MEQQDKPKKKNCLDMLSEYEGRKNRSIAEQYRIGWKYEFYVEDTYVLKDHKFAVKLSDTYCNSFMAQADSFIKPGEIVVGRVIGIDLNATCAEKMLKLKLPKTKKKEQVPEEKSIESRSPSMKEEVIIYKKSPEQWSAIVEGYGYHIYRNSFKCSCCQREFLSGQGYKIEKNSEDIVFCKECKRLIYPKKGNGWMNIISIPMGNKR